MNHLYHQRHLWFLPLIRPTQVNLGDRLQESVFHTSAVILIYTKIQLTALNIWLTPAYLVTM